MRHKPRVVIAGRPHYLYLRGNNRRLLFASTEDRIFWIDCMRRALDATQCQLHQMTLMNNRVHAVITPPQSSALSAMVKRACERYAQRRNQRRTGSGRLFAVGFVSRPLVDDGAVRDATLHADASALRAGHASDPFADKWSTAPLHAGVPGTLALRAVWTPSPWYTPLGATPEARATAYRYAMIEFLRFDGASAASIALEVEDEDARSYHRRVERPNGSWAREGQLRYRRKEV